MDGLDVVSVRTNIMGIIRLVQPCRKLICYSYSMTEGEEKKVQDFLDDHGRLSIWPSKHTNKQLALAYLASKFEAGRGYTEPEINDLLEQWHTFGDWPLLRRSLVDSGYFERDSYGKEYQINRSKPDQQT